MLTELLLLLVAVYSGEYLLVTGELYEGSQCTTSKGLGICQLLNEQCQSVYRDLLSGKPPELVCGYQGSIPIVCCPSNNKLTPTSTTTRRPIWTLSRPTTFGGSDYWSNSRPITTPKNPQANARLAKRMCAEYAKSVYVLTNAPVLTAEPLFVNESLCAIKTKKLIVGGTKAEPKEFPHSAAVGYGTGPKIHWSCGGTLVSDTFVVTAAHCLTSAQWGKAQWVRVGDLNLYRTDDVAKPQDRRIVQWIPHPKYKRIPPYDDIALLRLESPVSFNAYVRPACLDVKRIHAPGQKAVATGWGAVEFQDQQGNDDLLKVTLPIVTHEACKKSYESDLYILPNGIVDESQLCAGENQKDTCQGDSGGPLVIYSTDEECMYDVIGVTSFGAACGFVPGVYTRIYHYLSWLENIIWQPKN